MCSMRGMKVRSMRQDMVCRSGQGAILGGCAAVLGIDATSSRNRWFAQDSLSVQGQLMI